MFNKVGDDDTICALSTPPGAGGIAVVRVSGPRALQIGRKLCPFLPEQPESHKIYYGFCRAVSENKHDLHQQQLMFEKQSMFTKQDSVTNPDSDYKQDLVVPPARGSSVPSGDQQLDEVLVSYFKVGRSFTGEETLEISCHGGPIIVSNILKELVAAGCRTAKRGEFTYRAFMNGRLDLIQAESVLGLIESQSKQASRVALRQLQGQLSAEFSRVEDDLLWILANLEASIDFSSEGIEVISAEALESRAGALLQFIDKLLKSYGQGRILREGLQVAIVGRPNAGKSSLMNALLREDRSIVTAHAGTTRDLVEGRLFINGVPVTFVDTAGIRDTENEIEKIGIQRSQGAIEKSDLVFFVMDLASLWCEDLEFFAKNRPFQAYFIFNKLDLDPSGAARQASEEALEAMGLSQFGLWISAQSREGIDSIEEMMGRLVQQADSDSSNIITQARHFELLQKIQSCLLSAISLIKSDSSPEFIAFELQESIRAIHELLGKEFDEQVIDRIFKEFCLGK